MAVPPPVRRDDQRARPPVLLDLVRLTAVRPEDGIALALQPENVRRGPVPVHAGERAARRLPDVRAEDAVRQLERIAASSLADAAVDLGIEAPFLPLRSVEHLIDVRPEIAEVHLVLSAALHARHYARLHDGVEVILLLVETVREAERVVEDEVVVANEVHHSRRRGERNV